ncbi:MAG TPA: DUF6364 family protein [Nocardioidaceae bacterium]|nr:DUF6364 family protein [Nocardioidaceae bacterium]
MVNRNLTITLPEDLVRRAKVAAAKRDTSISALVTEHLRALADQDDDYDSVWRQERQLMAEGLAMSVGELTWSREELHER